MSEEGGSVLTQVILISIGSYFIGSEYTAALGWGVWFIAMALN